MSGAIHLRPLQSFIACTRKTSHFPLFSTRPTDRHYYHLSVPQLTHPFATLFISNFFIHPFSVMYLINLHVPILSLQRLMKCLKKVTVKIQVFLHVNRATDKYQRSEQSQYVHP